jgi:protein-tyrosine-phosphatase
MAEVRIDITAERPKALTTDAVRASDVVVTMGCGDTARTSPASATRTGSWTTPPVRASTPSARSGTRSAHAWRLSWPNCASPPRNSDGVG